MAAAAARTADGVIGHGLFTARWWDEVVRPAVERGQAQSERDAAALEHGWLITAIDDDDPERAVKDARRMVGFYLTVKTYDTFAEHHGWTAQVEELRAAFKQGDMDGLANAVTAEMLEAITVCGTTQDALGPYARRAENDSQTQEVTSSPTPPVRSRTQRQESSRET